MRHHRPGWRCGVACPARQVASTVRVSSSLLLLAALVGCQSSLSGSDPRPDVQTVIVDYHEACAYDYDERRVTVEGVLHLRPRLLMCSAGGTAPSGRACQLKLLPYVDAPTGDVETERRYFTTFIENGRGPSQLNAHGYGAGLQPVVVRDVDSVAVGPSERVRVTGTLRVRNLFARDLDEDGNPIGCTIHEVDRIERARTSAGAQDFGGDG